MASRNPNNLNVVANFLNLWPAIEMTTEWLAEIRLEYHVYIHAVCRPTPKEVLRSTQMDVSKASHREEVIVVYETHLKCGLRLPLPKFVLQLCEGWGVCPCQLAPNAFTVINAFCITHHLVNFSSLSEVFSPCYKLSRPRD